MQISCFLISSCLIGYVLSQHCPDSYAISKDKKYCYRLYTDLTTNHNLASEICKKENAFLVTIQDAFENSFVLKIIEEQHVMTWLGMSCKTNNASECMWEEGSNNFTAIYNNFIPGLPNPAIGNCVYMELEKPSPGRWASDNCDIVKMDFICKTYSSNNYSTSPKPTTGVCLPNMTTYMIANFVDGSGENLYVVEQTQMMLTFMANGSLLNIDDKRYKNTRMRVGLMGANYTAYKPNITSVSDIAPAFAVLEYNITHDTKIEYRSSLQQFADNLEYSGYDPNIEGPPIAILFSGSNDYYGSFDIKAGVDAIQAKGYKVICINMNADEAFDLQRDMTAVLGENNVYMHYLDSNDYRYVMDFIKYHICQFKPT